VMALWTRCDARPSPGAVTPGHGDSAARSAFERNHLATGFARSEPGQVRCSDGARATPSTCWGTGLIPVAHYVETQAEHHPSEAIADWVGASSLKRRPRLQRRRVMSRRARQRFAGAEPRYLPRTIR